MADEAPATTDTPWRRDPKELADRLARWATHAIGRDATVGDVTPPEGNGMSSETVLFTLRTASDVRGEPCVARLAPLPSLFPVFPEYDLDLQRRCMQLVEANTTVPVPQTPYYESDAAWVGTPFLVMSRIDGIVPSDNPPYVFGGWLVDATPQERARLQTSAVSVLARLHQCTPQSCDLSFLEHPEHGDTALDRQLGYQRWYYGWAREGVTYPLIEATFEWLDGHRPAERPAVLNWGDSRIGNMLFRDFETVAVLDWEMATVGPPEVDLSWMIFLHRFFQDIAEKFEMPGLPDFMRREDVVDEYEQLSGYTIHDLEWFEVFAALRFATVSVRTSTRGIAYGMMEKPQEPDDLIMFRGLLEQMLAGSYWD